MRRHDRQAQGMQMLASIMGKGQEHMQQYQHTVQPQQAERLHGPQANEAQASSMPGLSTGQRHWQAHWEEMGRQAAQAAAKAAEQAPQCSAPRNSVSPSGMQMGRPPLTGLGARSPTLTMPPPPPHTPAHMTGSKQARDSEMVTEVMGSGFIDANSF